MRINQEQARTAIERARVARLATASGEGVPHLVPVTFAVHDDLVVTAIDHKPKSPRKLKRLRNIEENPNVALLADHYEDDWSKLWWARADGVANITGAAARADLVAALVDKYPQYRRSPPDQALIVIQVHRWTGWRS